MYITIKTFDSLGKHIKDFSANIAPFTTIENYFFKKKIGVENKYIFVNKNQVEKDYIIKRDDVIQIQFTEYIHNE